jgi:hypothetical protein
MSQSIAVDCTYGVADDIDISFTKDRFQTQPKKLQLIYNNRRPDLG